MNVELISFREFARRRGCTLKAVQRAIKSGRISVTKDPVDGSLKIEPIQAESDWQRFTQLHKNPGFKDKLEKEDDSLGGDDELSEELKNDASFMEARRVREVNLARLAQLEYEQKSGKLIVAEVVERKLYEAARTTRDAILNIPNRVSSELSIQSDPIKVAELLTAELHLALEELSRVDI